MTIDPKAKRILDATRAILAEKGFPATTISEVASRAGVSRGLLHYYFKNKEDLLARVVRTNIDVSVGLVSAIFAHGDSATSLAEAFAAGVREVLRYTDLFAVFFESWTISRDNEALARELRILYRRFREAIHEGLKDAVERGAIAPRMPVNGLAIFITAIINGAALQMATEPDLIEKDDVWDTIRSSLTHALGG